MRRLKALCCALLLSAGLHLSAQSVVDSLRIDVILGEDGSASVTEVWNIDVRGSITEWYLVEDNLGRMDIRDLKVSDETGREYVSDGTSWNVDRSRQAKAGRCGMVRKSDGYELCWGVGSDGRHSYRVSYELLGLVKAYSDADGFNHMFVARGLGSSPENVFLTIRKQGHILTSSDTHVWGFGFNGQIDVLDGAVKAWSTEPFSQRSALIAMVSFEKGMFSPAITESGSFEQVKETAFEGSDYHDDSSEDRLFGFIGKLITGFFVFIIGYAGFSGIRNSVRTRRRKKELLGGVSSRKVSWYRDVPVGGNLVESYGIFNTFESSPQSLEHLLGAYMTRLYYKGAFSIVDQNGGKPAFRINGYDTSNPSSSVDIELENRLFDFFKQAAGSDSILQQKELRRWAASNGELLYDWQKDVPGTKSVWSMSKTDVQQVLGLRNFLRDFTLIKDRGVVEVSLWNNYLIYASMYGIANQVYKDFKKVCPEYFTLAQAQMSSSEVAPVVLFDTIGNTSRYMNSSASNYASSLSSSSGRWSGGGGTTSFGGGGGFSGGGYGGGGR